MMNDFNLEHVLNAKRSGAAPTRINHADPLLEIEMWQTYRSRLVKELDFVDGLLRDAAHAIRPLPPG